MSYARGLGRSLVLKFRMDAAFFQDNLFKLAARWGCFYAIKGPFSQWTGVLELRVAVFRKCVGKFALDAVLTNHYAANSAWQQLSILAHNLTVGFQLHSNLVTPQPHTAKRTYTYTYTYWLSSVKNPALHHDQSRRTRGPNPWPQDPALFHNPATQLLYDQVLDRFAA